MNVTLESFEKKKDYLICVDSDGCAMDTMDIKHIKCFGPCIVDEWELDAWRGEILERWNEINLYTMTRGVNRFKGLAMMLAEIDEKYCRIEDLAALEKWAAESDELSNAAIARAIEETDSVCLKKALSWSNRTNEAINALPESEKKPFAGVEAALAFAHEHADIAIVSSANLQAVEDEWKLYGLLPHVDILCAQNMGSKAYCIQELVKKGYDKAHVLMVGDAPGDQKAAESNGVLYYPILVKKETASWSEFQETAVGKLLDDSYAGEYQDKQLSAFFANLA